jgi:hypothetical protein
VKKKSYLFYTIILLGFYSCGSFKEIIQPSASPNTAKSFIELKDGQIISGTTIQYPGPAQLDFSKFDPFKKQAGGEDWVGIDGKQYKISEVYGAQDKGMFRAFTHDKIITRLRKGKLNLYWYETDAVVGSNTGFFKDPHYVYEASRGDFKQINGSLDIFYEAISANTAAAALCKELFPYLSFNGNKIQEEKLLQVVDLYNK